MESEFLDTEDSLSNRNYTQIFHEVIPYYLSIGMTYEEFYNQDVDLAIYYRKAHEIKEERHNSHLWLQGMYIYDAISTSLYNVFCRSKGQQSASYTSQPYPLTQKRQEEVQNLEIQEEQAKAQVWMNALVNGYK